MNPRTEERLEKVKRTSRSARRTCFWLMVFVLLAAATMALSTVGLPESLTCRINEANDFRRPCSDLPWQVVAFAYANLIGSVALVLAGLHRFARLFANYARGEIFTRASVREFRLVAYIAVAFVVFQGVLLVAALALAANGAIQSATSLPIAFGIGPILVAGLIVMLSWVMDVGAEMREENELTV
jgi:hypothetical protein